MSFNFWIDSEDDPLNLSNARAAIMINIMGLPVELDGEIRGPQLPMVAVRLTKTLYSREFRRQFVTTTQHGDRWISMGIDEEYIVRRASDLLALVIKAQENGTTLYWAG